MVDTLAGNCQTARHLKRPALALAICGDAAQAEKLAAEASKVFPNGTIWNTVQLPAIRAAIASTHISDTTVEAVGYTHRILPAVLVLLVGVAGQSDGASTVRAATLRRPQRANVGIVWKLRWLATRVRREASSAKHIRRHHRAI